MYRPLIVSLCTLSLLTITCITSLHADEAGATEAKSGTSIKSLAENQNDPAEVLKIIRASINDIRGLMFKNPEQAKEKIDELGDGLKSLKPTNAQSRKLLLSARTLPSALNRMLTKLGKPIDEQKALFEKNRESRQLLESLVDRMATEVAWLAQSDTKKALVQLKGHKEYFNGITKDMKERESQKITTTVERQFSRLEQALEREERVNNLVGKEAAPLSVKEWTNGTALTDEDLKGKVVLLDFWAIWCGPCRALFPSLRDWHDKYGEKGLVIIGVTRYYNYVWNEENKLPEKSKEKVSEQDERKMLDKFAEKHELKHRFAIQNGRALSEFYGARGIPHVVLIDKQGIIRKVVTGYSAGAAKETGALIKKLVEE